MKIGFTAQHWNDSEGRPTGGCSYGTGFTISWQNGPLGRGAKRKNPNGAFVEDVIDAVIDRLDYYQCSRFECSENATAISHLRDAMKALNRRTENREARQVEGTHTP